MFRDISAVDMLTIIGRARLALGATDAAAVLAELRTLQPHEVVSEFHKAVVVLDRRGALTCVERADLREYATDYVRSGYSVPA